ncbi:hypothetical protein IJI99_00075, partial [bacterium]|nr:hypothetical protein [bacterium]
LSEVGVDWKLEVLPEHPWLIHEFNTANPETVAAANEFPLTGSDRLKWKWCYDHAFVHLDGDWPAATISKIIFTRLEAGIDSNLHDASYWLQTFIIPNYSYNIAAIKNAVTNDEPIESLDKYQLILRNHYTELGLLAKILQVEPTLRERINLSRKEQVVTTLFTSPENILLYQELVKMMREPECNLQLLQEKVREELEVFYQERIQNTAGKPSQWRVSLEEFGKRVQETLEKLGQMTQSQQSEMSISDLITQLKTYGQNRKLYIDDASAWLEKHIVTPSSTLTKVWGDRALALANGVSDRATEIAKWQKQKALFVHIQNNPGILDELNLKKEELYNTYKSFVEELSRVYDAEQILRGVALYKVNKNPEKLMSMQVIDLETGKQQKNKKQKFFKGIVLAHDDPRGMTIGPDTGCCMTINGVSESCIASGYSDKEAGFFALYDPDGQLMAQSYFYINPNRPDVVIMDNIEANQGRDFDKILKLYQQFFREYFLKQFADNPDWQVRQVNIGEGYTDVSLQDLERVDKPILNSRDDVYSDAHRQRFLFRLSDEEIAKVRQSKQEPVKEAEPVEVIHKTIEMTRTMGLNQLPILQSLEAQLYPENMRQYDDEDFAESELSQPGVGKYSFLIEAQTDANRQAVGYCLAYEAESETDPQYPDKVVYIADFGIVPEAQKGNAALKGLNELLKRLQNNNVQKVELDARESTSYKFFKSEAGQRYLARHGYQVKEYDTTTDFGEGEKTYMLSLEKTDNKNSTNTRLAAS